MFGKKNIKIFHLLILFTIMGSFFVSLYKNKDYFPLPNGDVFQYIDDGHQYINFKLPSNIHPPPFFPFLICFTAKIFKHIEYPELYSASIITFVASTLILLNVFLLLYKKSPLLALSTVFLLATNKIYFLTSIDLTNEIIYGFFLTLTLLLYQKKHYNIAYLLSGLLFLIRYESIVFQLSIFVVEFFYHKKQFKIKNIIIAFTPVILWLIVLNFHSVGSSIFQNAYFLEIYHGIKNVPNFSVFKSLADIILFNPFTNFTYRLFSENQYNIFFSNIINTIIPIIIFFLFLLTFFRRKDTNINKIAYLTLFLHLLFIASFPQFCIRYLTPVIWIVYLLIINRSNNTLKILIIISLIIFNFSQINNKSNHGIPDGFEYRYVVDWLNKQNLHKTTRVLIYDPVIIKYYIYNSNITIDFNSYEYYDVPNIYNKCQDNMTCVVKELNKRDSNSSQIYIVTTSYSSLSIENFPDQETTKMHHMPAFRNFPTTEENSYYKLLDTIGNSQYWAKIYQYIPPKIL
jgi:hypothetical protein